jgi:hypothetical protein
MLIDPFQLLDSEMSPPSHSPGKWLCRIAASVLGTDFAPTSCAGLAERTADSGRRSLQPGTAGVIQVECRNAVPADA